MIPRSCTLWRPQISATQLRLDKPWKQKVFQLPSPGRRRCSNGLALEAGGVPRDRDFHDRLSLTRQGVVLIDLQSLLDCQ